MKLPELINILVITLSDRASRGEYEDESGPCIAEMAGEFFNSMNTACSITRELIPDDAEILKQLVVGLPSGSRPGCGPRPITSISASAPGAWCPG